MPDFRSKKILITGGLGFIGSSLARRLAHEGADVTVVDSLIPEYGGNLFNISGLEDRVKVNISDVRDPHSLAYLVANQDYLFNLAGQTSHLDSMNNPKADLDINAGAQLFILEACRKNNPQVRIVFASTRQIYGKPESLPVPESHPIRPVDVNGINKLAGEWYHLLYNNVYGIPTTCLRLTNTYGPRMRIKDARQTFLGIWLKCAVEKTPFKIFGDGLQLRDFNYVDDVVEAFILAATNPSAVGQVYNLGHHEVVNLKTLARMLSEIAGDTPFECIPFPDDRKAIDIGDYYSDYNLIKNQLGWEPKIQLKDGLKLSFDYYLAHHNNYM